MEDYEETLREIEERHAKDDTMKHRFYLWAKEIHTDRATLIEAVRRWGNHSRRCYVTTSTADGGRIEPRCTCGLDDFLSTPEATQGE